ncbi:hypothetical protein ACL02T_20100 [Pseudonocardia sp. RS010]|uniref:hypothetical protein n=1 Tax=Pseudonocardia sp. RS010 TaxID=3385979 RepID=UPI0039A14E89
MDDLRRSRLDARDRGLRRASRTTGWAAVGGVAATAVAALVFARSPASADSEDPAPAPQPATTAAPVPGSAPTTAGAPSTAPPVRHHLGPGGTSGARSTGSGSVGTGGSGLQPPATAPRPTSGRHAHVGSGAS